MLAADNRILITGGSGALGSAISKLIPCIAPNSSELNITDYAQCQAAIERYNPDIVIHCAAWTDVAGAEKAKDKCWEVNVTGTENMVRAATGCRFIYISTEYVFDGERGNYKEDDIPRPVNFYALTKLCGEIAVRQYPNTLIIRTAFKQDGPWPYEAAFVDKWMSVDFVSERVPDILRASLMTELTGLIHVSGARKTIYDLAIKVSPKVKKMSIKDVPVILPKDTSLDSSRWKEICSTHK